MREIHASALPRIWECPASAANADMLFDSSSGAATMGTAVHEALARVVAGVQADLGAVVRKYEVDGRELRGLFYAGLALWNLYEGAFERVEAEVAARAQITDDIAVVGTRDIVGVIDERRMFVGDWKSNRVEREYRHQLNAYAYITLAGHPDVDEAVCCILWLRERTRETWTVTRAELKPWADSLLAKLTQGANRYTNDIESCTFCPLEPTCPAREALMNRAKLALVQAGDNKPVAALDLARLKPQADALAQTLKHYNAALRVQLEKEGSIDLGDGREMTLRTQHADTILPGPGLPVVCKALAEAAGMMEAPEDGGALATIAPYVKIAKTAMLDAVANAASRGKKAKSRRNLMEALERAGAVRTKAIKRITVNKKKEEA